MRRTFVFILFLIAFAVLVAGAWAAGPPVAQTAEPLPVAKPPDVWLGDEVELSIADLEPLSADAPPAADTCSTATPLFLSLSQTADGSGTLTNGFTHEATDPIPACTFGQPSNARGYRTAWHVLVPGSTGVVTITTEGTNYDTILTVHDGACGALRALTCADDTLGFQSKTTFPVVRGRTYYILVADYNFGAPASADLRISATMARGGQRWQQVSNLPRGGVSRHAFASLGLDMFIIGGQERIQGQPVLTNKLLRHNVEANRWTELADMPGPGLSNTTAARLGLNIYVPGGFNGSTSAYSFTHLVYNIETDFWAEAVPIPPALQPGGKPFGWAAAVAAPGETSYYLTGGITSIPPFVPNSVVINNTYRFTPSTNTWEASRPMTTARFAHTAAWISEANRGLCVTGGLSTGTSVEGQSILVLLTGGECYNPASGAGWQATGPMNFPRYNAGSAIGPDGRWYVFGGVDASGLGVPETEVYDAVSNTWLLLGNGYTLGGQATDPGIEWPRGAFWRENLYIYGGNTPREQRVVSAVERLTLGSSFISTAGRTFLPIASKIGSDNILFWATYMPLNTVVQGNFERSDQFYNPYYFDWPAFGRATVRLRNIPENTNYNIAIYDANKVVMGEGNTAITGDKDVSATLLPGRYYVVVQRIFPKDLPNRNVVYDLSVSTP